MKILNGEGGLLRLLALDNFLLRKQFVQLDIENFCWNAGVRKEKFSFPVRSVVNHVCHFLQSTLNSRSEQRACTHFKDFLI